LFALIAESPDNVSMFVREKRARGYSYLYLVENEDGRIRSGSSVRSAARMCYWPVADSIVWPPRWCVHCDRAVMLSDMEAGRIACTHIGGPLLFGRLWERRGIAEVLCELLQDRG
jgi:hypothetical protein